ncbi:MAG: hypothetical protein QOG50_1698, partial [Actinomycetota bacterium]|nr:hypothetical protein [Actinomycetota bacterium]
MNERARKVWIAIAIVVGGLIVLNLLAQLFDRAVGGDRPGGPAGSSYATAPGGLAAFGALLARYDHEVGRQRGSITDQSAPENATVFVLEPNELTAGDTSALLQFVTAGGRLVIGGESPFYVRSLRDAPPKWQPSGAASWTKIDPALG